MAARRRLSGDEVLTVLCADSDSEVSDGEYSEDNEELEVIEARPQLVGSFDPLFWLSLDSDHVGDRIIDRDMQPIPLFDISNWKPVDFFLQFFPDSLFAKIAEETNIYAMQFLDSPLELPPSSRFLKWKSTSPEEIKAYVGLELAMGLVQKPAISDYWDSWWLTETTNFGSVMSRNRFQLLRSFLHFTNNENRVPRNQEGYDPLFKVRSLIDTVLPTYLNTYYPSQYLSVDESMRKFKGRIFYKQYIPKKPTKWGIKVWALSDAKTGFLLNWKVYTGGELEKQSGHNVVMNITKPIHGTGRIIFCDSFFTSPGLPSELKTIDLGLCGTVRPNRIGMPEELRQGKVNLSKGDDPVYFFHADQQILCSSWHDVARVNILSSVHGNETIEKNVRSKHHEGGLRSVKKPKVMEEYNKYMSGVDRFDQYACYYTFPHKSTKHYHVIYHFIKEVAMVNGYILYKINQEKPISSKKFRKMVIDELVKSSVKDTNVTKRHSNPERRLLERHFPNQFEDKKHRPDCHVCSDRSTPRGRKQTSFYCKECNVPLCVVKCFEKFHTVVNFRG